MKNLKWEIICNYKILQNHVGTGDLIDLQNIGH